MISVIVPVYNAEAYLKTCVDSLLAQSCLPLEIILIDDGSTDGSGQICEAYAKKDGRVRVVHQKNRGVSAARNAGIDAAAGEYLIFVDSDDFVHQNLLEFYLEHLQKDYVPVCRIQEVAERVADTQSMAAREAAYSFTHVKDCEGHTNSLCNKIYTLDHFMEFFCDDHVNPPWNKIYNIEILRRHQIYFPEDMNLGEDLIFNLRYLKYAPKTYRVSAEELYFYRQGSQESLSSRFRAELFELQLYMFEQLRIFLQDADVWNQENRGAYYRTFWNRLYLTLTIYMEQQRKVRTSELQEYIRAALNNPIWTEVWSACRREGIITGKMRIKKARVDLLKGSKGK